MEAAIGPHAVALAMRRCADCGSRYDCGWREVDCLNGELFSAALKKRASTFAA